MSVQVVLRLSVRGDYRMSVRVVLRLSVRGDYRMSVQVVLRLSVPTAAARPASIPRSTTTCRSTLRPGP